MRRPEPVIAAPYRHRVPHRAVVAAASLAFLAPHGSAVAANQSTANASGVIVPGIEATGCAQQRMDLSGTMAVAGTLAGTYTFDLRTNSSICESVASGAGAGELRGDVSSTSFQYSRTGSAVTLSGTLTIQGTTEVITSGSCTLTFVPGQVPQTTTLSCSITTA